MVRVRFEFDKARPVLESILAYTAGRYVTREWQIRYGRRTLFGEFGATPLTAVGVFTQFLEDLPYQEDVEEIGMAIALSSLDDVISVRVYSEPIAWFSDTNTLVVKGLEKFSTTASNWKVTIDGASVTVSGVEGDANQATLSLAEPVPKGAHDVIIAVEGGKKAFYGKLYVP